MIEFRSIRRCEWLFLDKSIGEFSIVYKQMRTLLWLRVYNHDFGFKLVQLHKVCLDILDALLTIFFTRVSCDMQISQTS